MISHLELDIQEGKMKWALGSIGCDGITDELFQTLKDDAVKNCTQYASKLGKLGSGHRTGKGQFSFQSQRKTMPKNAQSESDIAQSCPTLCDPSAVAHQAPPSMGFSRQEYWSGFSFPSPKECSNCHTIALISHASKEMLEILQARLQ